MRKAWLAALIAALAAGCTPRDDDGAGEPVVIEERGEGSADGVAAGGAAGADTAAEGADLTGAGGMAALDDPASPLSKRVFYFEFDRHDLSEEDRAALSAHAAHLAANPALTVVVEGHADERGSREYNLSLGERRAKAVASLLKLQGASGAQLQVISFGEERPVALEHDDAAWRLNRRVELLYSGN